MGKAPKNKRLPKVQPEDMDDFEYSAFLLTVLIKEILPLVEEERLFPLMFQYVNEPDMSEDTSIRYGKKIVASMNEAPAVPAAGMH